jgi:hypothetical protein
VIDQRENVGTTFQRPLKRSRLDRLDKACEPRFAIERCSVSLQPAAFGNSAQLDGKRSGVPF